MTQSVPLGLNIPETKKKLEPTPYPVNSPETKAQFSPRFSYDILSGTQLGLLGGAHAIGAHSIPGEKPMQKPKPSLDHTSTHYPMWGPIIGLASWGPIGVHSIPGEQSETQVQFSPRMNTISKLGPTGLAVLGPISAHSIPSKQPRNPSLV